jgi:hypothetical protein
LELCKEKKMGGKKMSEEARDGKERRRVRAPRMIAKATKRKSPKLKN